MIVRGENTNSNPQSRKRMRRPETWKRNIKKNKVNSGLPYVSEGNKEIPGKFLKPSCGQICRLKCASRFTETERQVIHTGFWKLADNSLQRQYVSGNIEIAKTKYRRVVEGSSRGENLWYHLTSNGKRMKVCKKFFMNTLDISDKFIRTTWKKANGRCAIDKDMRGNQTNRENVSPAIKNNIMAHINSFHRVESHYLRAQTTREYIDGSLNIAQMYRYYKAEQEAKGMSVGKKSMYINIFNTKFNISFFQPKKDQCSFCETFKNSTPEEQLNLQQNYEQHIKNKTRSREEKVSDVLKSKENSSIKVACFDLQAVFSLWRYFSVFLQVPVKLSQFYNF